MPWAAPMLVRYFAKPLANLTVCKKRPPFLLPAIEQEAVLRFSSYHVFLCFPNEPEKQAKLPLLFWSLLHWTAAERYPSTCILQSSKVRARHSMFSWKFSNSADREWNPHMLLPPIILTASFVPSWPVALGYPRCQRDYPFLAWVTGVCVSKSCLADYRRNSYRSLWMTLRSLSLELWCHQRT